MIQVPAFPRFARSLTVLAAASLVASCGGGGGDSTPKDVSINFAAIANGAPVQCGGTVTGLGTTGAAASVKDLRFYVSNVALLDIGGNAVPVSLATNGWQSDKVALISLLDATGTACVANANVAVTGTVPQGTYVGLQFEMGVPESVNHTDTVGTAAPLNVAAMAWSWQAGRKFAKIEVDPQARVTKADATTTTTWNFHLGSTGCKADTTNATGYVCTNSNRMPVRLTAFDATTQAVSINLTELFSTSDVTRDTGGAVGCMSGATDADCTGIFSTIKVNFTSGAPLDGGSATQKVFAARTK